ncbi:MAG: TAXI family TRAP transporter solute-binding subunit [Acetobacterales bacterium]
MNVVTRAAIASAAALWLCAGAGSAEAKPANLTVLGGPIGGTWEPVSAGISKVLSDAGVPTTAEVGAGLSNLINVSVGKGDIALLVSTAGPDGANAVPPFKTRITNVRGLAALYPNYQHTIVRADSGIASLQDLKGKRLATGAIGSATAQAMSQILAAAGVDEAGMQVQRGSFTFGANALKDRNVDVLNFFTGAPNGTTVELFTTGTMKLLPIPDDVGAAMKKLNEGYSFRSIPANSYPGQTEPVATISNDSMLIVNAKLSDDDAYWITRTLAENQDKLRSTHAVLGELDKNIMADIAGLPVHPGALRYYKEVGAAR